MGSPVYPLFSIPEEWESNFSKWALSSSYLINYTLFTTEQLQNILKKCFRKNVYLFSPVDLRGSLSPEEEDKIIDLLNLGFSGIKYIQIDGSKPLENKTSIPDEKFEGLKATCIISSYESYINSVLPLLKTDRKDGLYTTLVTDLYDKALGVCYSSKESLKLAFEQQIGVYYSRSRDEIWVKGKTSGNTQQLLSVDVDCDADCLKFKVVQQGEGFCHEETRFDCFGNLKADSFGLQDLYNVIDQRYQDTKGRLNEKEDYNIKKSYTQRLFSEKDLLDKKILEEANEFIEATEKDHIAFEFADLVYFAFAKLAANGVTIADVEDNLRKKHLKVTRRQGDAKPEKKEPVVVKEEPKYLDSEIELKIVTSEDPKAVKEAFTRPIQSTSNIMALVEPIIKNVKTNGDAALLELTAKFDKVSLDEATLKAPFPKEYIESLSEEMIDALDMAIGNVERFHQAQYEQNATLAVETQPGVLCERFAKPIESVGCYVPGGTAVLPSTAIMLGVPAKVAGCKEIVFATPPNKEGKVPAEVVYVADKIGCETIVLAGGAQAVAAMAYGTQTVPKVDKILGPGNQFVTAAKMYVSQDTAALCAIDMPAGPSEVLVICDKKADWDYVASDLLSQAEHGVDSQVILIGIDLDDDFTAKLQNAIKEQTLNLPRKEIVKRCLYNSCIVKCKTVEEAFKLSNEYAPEHLILQIEDAHSYVKLVDNAGSIFVGALTPESCGDYSSGTNHTLPTYGFAKQYSGVNTSTYQKFITCQYVNEEGLKKIGYSVMNIANREGLDAHKMAVKIRLAKLGVDVAKY
ncbi:hypothetical protein FOG50_03001 [Hanseniaspora uvarum]|nr:hypothetical protein FOG50_03001 [Hanseniaspora uvarum]